MRRHVNRWMDGWMDGRMIPSPSPSGQYPIIQLLIDFTRSPRTATSRVLSLSCCRRRHRRPISLSNSRKRFDYLRLLLLLLASMSIAIKNGKIGYKQNDRETTKKLYGVRASRSSVLLLSPNGRTDGWTDDAIAN